MALRRLAFALGLLVILPTACRTAPESHPESQVRAPAALPAPSPIVLGLPSKGTGGGLAQSDVTSLDRERVKEGSATTVPSSAGLGSAAGAQHQVSHRQYSVAALGDSITDYRTLGGGYLRHLEKRCPSIKISNFGKGGDMVNQMRRRFEADILSAPPGTYSDLIVFGGVNDLYSDETAGRINTKIEADLAAIYSQAKQAKMRVIALTVAPWGGFKRYFTPARSEHTQSLNAWIKSQKGGLVDEVIDTYPLLSCGDPERFCEAYEFSRPDGLHFNREAHDKLGEAVWAGAFGDCR
ncbi:MAG: SGNH/GDSL hydrolase family protein [Polyangiaceae bacterium]|nr:SGNH/GDSL hydrolase family protein [Polyangiaceae bacterium]